MSCSDIKIMLCYVAKLTPYTVVNMEEMVLILQLILQEIQNLQIGTDGATDLTTLEQLISGLSLKLDAIEVSLQSIATSSAEGTSATSSLLTVLQSIDATQIMCVGMVAFSAGLTVIVIFAIVWNGRRH